MSAHQPTRREILRVGGGSLLGLSLAQMLELQARAGSSAHGAPGWGRARSVILIFLQGGPSHIDLWDPKDGVPEDVVSPFKTIPSRVPGMELTELMPRLSEVTDKLTLIRSMSYSPNGLFNHTAAHYQMLTGYTTDRVSPSGQLEPPSPKDFPNLGCNITRLRPPDVPMLPFVMMPRPLQESNVIGKAGTAGFLGRAHDPFTLYPTGDDLDNEKMNRIQAGDLALRGELSLARLERRAKLRSALNERMEAVDRAVAQYDLDEYTERALDLVLSGRARDAFDIDAEPDWLRDRYGRTTFGQCCLLARRLVEAGTRFVQVNWPKVANSDRHSWDVHKDLNKRMKNEAAPMLDPALASLLTDLDARGLLDETLVVAVGEFGRSPRKGLSTSGNDNDADGRDHWPYCFTAVAAGGGVKRGHVHGRSDETASAPIVDPVHPGDLLATIYHAVGIDPETIVMNHLNQPRELVKGKPVLDLFA
ncbi:MAG: DUF1501 domain-containing protein [Planctomycetota bacterium]|jgi:hypothetical protein|nr:DUF1501 domain-containing protein [Planctomycetota bacterium]MDP6763233.1 DUF1501 domain-containing protein [Planctomycetota bacterium]MDP6990558.1 DUF1501 domain-containing protein [Planctomycetota bacterium]